MNLLITGGDGFLAKECWDYFSANSLYNVIVTNRSNLDILKPQAVKNFFKKHTIDIVIHTAVSGGKRTSKDTIETLHHNILMYHNLIDNLPRISKMFMFALSIINSITISMLLFCTTFHTFRSNR